MALVNYSIPKDLKEAFDKAFKGRNKSAIIADLMRDAVENENTRKTSVKSLDELRMRRAVSPILEDGDIDLRESRRRR